MTLDDYINFYNNIFKPVYADTITLLADKPRQLIIEQENSLSHLISYLKDNSDIDNLKKAQGHIERATLDAYKMSWVEIKKELIKYSEIDKKNVSIAFNLPEEEFLQKIKKFHKMIKEARRLELNNIGNTHKNIKTIETYAEAIKIGYILLESADIKKYNSYQNFNLKDFIQNHIIGFILGIIASIVSTFILK